MLASVTENARQVMAREMGALAMATDEKGTTWRRGVARLRQCPNYVRNTAVGWKAEPADRKNERCRRVWKRAVLGTGVLGIHSSPGTRNRLGHATWPPSGRHRRLGSSAHRPICPCALQTNFKLGAWAWFRCRRASTNRAERAAAKRIIVYIHGTTTPRGGRHGCCAWLGCLIEQL